MTDVEAAPRSLAHRPDIDGLRAVAILAVVLYHAGVPGFSGGFVGVDVFFVISGYLITGKLLGEARSTQRVRLGNFWAGRVRRLVPALAVVVAVTLLAGLLVLGPFEWKRAALDGCAALLYVSNVVFARGHLDYFTNSTPSLFTHTWSLSVEEQFYLVWPVLVLALTRLFRRRPARAEHALAAVLGLGGVVSFALYAYLTARGSPWAFFSLPTRAWEFALGGLAMYLVRRDITLRAPWDAVVAAVGLLVVLVSVRALSDVTPYPGLPTWLTPAVGVLPAVLGATALVFAGQGGRATLLHRGLASRPAQDLGRVSYSWYLWHWPVMLLLVAAVERDTLAVRGAGVLLALGIAALSLRFVERPIRFGRPLVRSPLRSFAVGAAFTLVAGVIALGVYGAGSHKVEQTFYQRIAEARKRPEGFNSEAECIGVGSVDCTFGPEDSPVRILMLGDSHAAQWRPAVERAAYELGYRITLRTLGGCPSVPVAVTRSSKDRRERTACIAFQGRSADLARKGRFDAVVLANSTYIGRILDEQGETPSDEAQLEIWTRTFEQFISELSATGLRVGTFADNPVAGEDPNLCMERTGSMSACRPSRHTALGDVGRRNDADRRSLERLAAEGIHVLRFEPTDDICAEDPCTLEEHGTLVFRDANHLSNAFTVSRKDELVDYLRSLAST